MSESDFALDYLRDPRLALHATGAMPAWLWSADGSKILWANPTAAAILDASSPAKITALRVDESIANQIASLATTMSTGQSARLARLRGLPIGFGRALTCLCSRIPLAERSSAILVVSVEQAGPRLTLEEQVRRLLAGSNAPVAFFLPEGKLLYRTASAQMRLGSATTLAAFGAEELAAHALANGKANAGDAAMERIGNGASTVLMAIFGLRPAAMPKAPSLQPAPFVAASPAPEPRPFTASTAISPAPTARQQPLRFLWQMDAATRFTIGSEEFGNTIGLRTASALGRPWHEITAALSLDPERKIARAIETRETWSAITVDWPIDDTNKYLPVELSAFPVFDREGEFRGYRGFGVCRDVVRLAELMSAPRSAAPRAPMAPTQEQEAPKAAAPAEPQMPPPATPIPPAPPADKVPPTREERPVLTVVPPSKNVVPFRASAPPDKAPGLSAVERKAFHEIARQLSSRLGITGVESPPFTNTDGAPTAPMPGQSAADWTVDRTNESPSPAASGERGATGDESTILDRLPVGVLLYRHNKLIYANRTLLDWTGYQNLDALAQAGGLDQLFSEPGLDLMPETGAKSLAITNSSGEQLPVEGRLFQVPWENESALALVLMLASSATDDRQRVAEMALRHAEAEARELHSILDTATDGVIMLDHEGHVLAGNRSAEALFGYESHEITALAFNDLFAPESQRVALDYLDGLLRAGVASVLNDGREVIGRVREGGLIPLFMTMGRIGDGDEKFCAVFRDITQWKKAEEELVSSKRQAEKTSSAKSEFLAKISHEIRTPLNSIIGFSEVMMEERFGPIGNERYKQYIKDIHSSGGHLVSLLNDLLDLSKIEAGKLELTFARVDLNMQVQQCVALMQPQANRERIIIRTSLAPTLPPVVADARSVRQIVINLLSNSIKFSGAGGQVIVSTTLNDGGEVVLRVRDTGAGMSEQDILVALEPFRQLATSARWGSSGTGLGLPLTKALAEANRANFSITSRLNAGTLVEISFPSTRVLAE
jgi:PAS domain S-box-containing protein